jgi:hypothetical protein
MASAPIALFIGIVLVWVGMAFGPDFWPCEAQPSVHVITVLATATICVVLWANHLRYAPIKRMGDIGRIFGGATYDLVLLVLAFTVIVIPLAVLTPTYECMTDRQKVSMLLASSSTLKQAITERIQENHTLSHTGSGLTITPNNHVSGGLVTADGTIIIASNDPPAVIILTPALHGTEVQWQCQGFPPAQVPSMCRISAVAAISGK